MEDNETKTSDAIIAIVTANDEAHPPVVSTFAEEIGVTRPAVYAAVKRLVDAKVIKADGTHRKHARGPAATRYALV